MGQGRWGTSQVRRASSENGSARARARPGDTPMRVWQPGSHLSMDRATRVSDWSWRQTARRLRTLALLTAPYKLRTALASGSLLAATATALAPPFLAKLAIDDGIRNHDLTRLGWIVAGFLAPALA